MTHQHRRFDLEEFLLDIRLFDKLGDQELYMGKTVAGYRVRVDPAAYDELPFLYHDMSVHVRKEEPDKITSQTVIARNLFWRLQGFRPTDQECTVLVMRGVYDVMLTCNKYFMNNQAAREALREACRKNQQHYSKACLDARQLLQLEDNQME